MHEWKARSINITFETQKYAPSHQVTVVCDDSLSGSPLYGQYYNGAWHFELKVWVGKQPIMVRFRLDQEFNMAGEPIAIKDGTDQLQLDEEQVIFSPPPGWHDRVYIHHIDRLVTEDNDFQRRLILANYADIEYDAIVIGSGMGGGILADQLSDAGQSVLVLEAGSVHLPENIVNLPVPNTVRSAVSYQMTEGFGIEGDICMNFGGRSIYWSALIPRMNCWDMEHWPKDVRTYLTEKGGYDRAEILFRKRTEFTEFEQKLRLHLQLKFCDFDVDHLPRSFHSSRSILPRPRGNLDEVPTGTFSTAALLLNSLSYEGSNGKDNLTVNLNHLVTHLETKDDRITAVVCRDLIHHRVRKYRAKHIILAAGATESPCIVLRDVNFADESKKIGIGLTGHQWSELVKIKIPKESSLLSVDDRAKLLMIPKDWLQVEHPFSCELSLNTDPWDVRYEDDELLEEKVREARKSGYSVGKLKFTFGSALDDQNKIELVPDGKPRVRVGPMNRILYNQTLAAQCLANDILDHFGIKTSESWKHKVTPQSHHVGGSLRMGDDPQHSVVDTNLKFHGYKNLYCCDLSVFPYIPVANPSLTLGALAIRLADHIAPAPSGGSASICGNSKPKQVGL